MKLSRAHSRGFTLIELLVVIGVLGILAAGLLATIDPIEQLKKARDTNDRSAALELYNSLVRFYGNHGVMPWGGVIAGLTTCDNGTDFTLSAIGVGALRISGTGVSTNFVTCLEDSVVAEGELKDTFFKSLSAAEIWVGSLDKGQVTVCYIPQSISAKSTDATYKKGVGVFIDDKKVRLETGGDGCPWDKTSTATCAQCFQ